MLGRICWGSDRKVELAVERICGLSVWRVRMSQVSRRPERVVKKGIDLLRKEGVTHVLTPPGFPWWPELMRAGLRPVETRNLRCMLAPVWVHAQLDGRNVPRERAVLRLKGERYEPVLESLAKTLCPLVRRMVFHIPGGETTADTLRREMGMPVLPGDFGEVQLTLRLADGPVLTGAEITLPGRELPTDCDTVGLISVLWETGRIKSEEIVLKL